MTKRKLLISILLFLIYVVIVWFGAGFFVSAIAAWGLSHRLGLFAAAGSSGDSGTGHAS